MGYVETFRDLPDAKSLRNSPSEVDILWPHRTTGRDYRKTLGVSFLFDLKLCSWCRIRPISDSALNNVSDVLIGHEMLKDC